MKKAFLVAIFLFSVARVFSQPNCTAKILNVQDGRIDACFVRTPNPIGNITKYTILVGGIEKYEVEFTYEKEGDSILIRFYDKQNTSVKLQCVKLKPQDSHFLICDFLPNQKQISNDKNYKILFGIDHPNEQFITLYQFQAIGGVQSQFILQEVPPEVLSDHAEAVIDYEKIVLIRETHHSYIRLLRQEMLDYKDSVINNILEKEKAIKSKKATLVADGALKTAFTSKMDALFVNYFKNVHSFSDETLDVNFSFACDGYGKIIVDTVTAAYFTSNSQKHWLRDSFLLHIKPRIEEDVYTTGTDTYTNQRLKSDFSNWFERKFDGYTLLGQADRDSFTSVKEYVNGELERYITRTISIPIVYNYSFKYLSSVKQPVWRYVGEGGGNDKFIDKSDNANKVEITDRLKQIFKNKYASLGKGKYNLKVSTIYINNDAYMGQDIQLINTK